MKKLFLLLGFILSFVVVAQSVAGEPPGVNRVSDYAFVMDDAYMTADAAVINMDYPVYAFDAAYTVQSIENAETRRAEYIPLINCMNLNYDCNHLINEGLFVARSGVIKSNELSFLSEPICTLTFKAKARSWINLTSFNFHYLCIKSFQLSNFDGKPDRFY